ncbi:MAG: hypothetical protein HYY67_03370 [Thaumarchaeota archaeon]|nr:hypothetical protein [Nitrososphaerota archaeon]
MMYDIRQKVFIARALTKLAKMSPSIKNCPPFETLWGSVAVKGADTIRQMISMQAIAVTMETIENFAAMCFAYGEALDHGRRFFPLILRDFGKMRKKYADTPIATDLGDTQTLLRKMCSDGNVLKQYLGLQGAKSDEVSEKRAIIETFLTFWEANDSWYNKFKHTNSVFGIYFAFDVPGLTSLAYRIPDSLRHSDKDIIHPDRLLEKELRSVRSLELGTEVAQIRTESLFTPYQFMDDMIGVLDLIEKIWKPLKTEQHKRVFGETFSA